MSHSFLIHVSKTIPRSKVNQAIFSQLQSPVPTKPFSLRCFSTSRSQNSVTIWGGEAVKKTLKEGINGPVCIGITPVRGPSALCRTVSSFSNAAEFKRRNPKDDPADQAPASGGSSPGGHGENGHGDGEGGGNGGNGGNDGRPKNHSWDVADNQLQKPTVPEVYPQVLALPISGRPLFPGFYKAVVIKEPTVTSAIKELMKRGQPYVGAFLLKEEGLETDTISSIDQVHRVGVFAQITSVFPASSGKEDGGLTAVLYPHRRIKITDLLPIKDKQHSVAAVEEVSKHDDAIEKSSKEVKPKAETGRTVAHKSGKSLHLDVLARSFFFNLIIL